MQDFFFEFMGKWSYLGLFLVLMAAGLGVPLPEDIPLVAAGWLVHKGGADLRWMIITGLVGVLLGDSILFFLGRQYGSQIVERRWFRRIAKPWLLEKARLKYAQHGAKIIFVARFMPGLRAVVFLTAGVFRVPYWKFILMDGLAALISVPAWLWLSSEFSGAIEHLLGGARVATYVMGGVLIAALVGWGIWEYRHNLRKQNGAGKKEIQAASAPAVSLPTPPGNHADRPEQPLNPHSPAQKTQPAEPVR